MVWWKAAIYDTCSIITLDKMLQARKTMARHFPAKILALRESFAEDQLRRGTAKRMSSRVTAQDLPTVSHLTKILDTKKLPRSLAAIDTLVYATAIHHELDVVTSSRPLGEAIRKAGLRVANIPLLLRELVKSERLSEKSCERLLIALAKQGSLVLKTAKPTWPDLKRHKFP